MTKLILVDSRVVDIADIASSLMPNTEMITFKFLDDSFESLKAKITGQYESVCIVQHNYGYDTVKFLNCMPEGIIKDVEKEDPELLSWAPIVELFSWLKTSAGCQYIDLLACNIWASADWRYAILKLREVAGIYIRASVNITGAGGDFILESDNVDLIGIYFTENINNYKYQFYYQPTGTYAPHNAFGMQPTLPSGGNVSVTAYMALVGSMVNCGTGLAGTTYINPPTDMSNIVQFVNTAYQAIPSSYAAITNTGKVITFGRNTQGGDSSGVAVYLSSGVTKVVATGMAFAALRSDGTVVSWGQVLDNNGLPANITLTTDLAITPYTGAITGCIDIASSIHTFSALKSDGTVVTWGTCKKWASATSVLTGVTKIKETYGYPNYAYIALRSDGHAVMWGPTGVATTTSLTSTSPIVDIYPTDYNCVIVRQDKKVYKGFTNTVSYTVPAGKNILNIYALNNSIEFAVLMDDRSLFLSDLSAVYQNVSYFNCSDTAYGFISNGAVTVRGDSRSGGSTTDATNGIKSGISVSGDVIKLASSQGSMAALKSNGTVAVWGANAGGWPYVSSVQSQLTNVVHICDLLTGYVAFTSDNRLISWGQGANVWYGSPTNPVVNNMTVAAGKTVAMFSALQSPFIVEYDKSMVVTPSTVTNGSSNTITFTTNVAHNYAEKGRKYGLYYGSSRLASFLPTTNTYTYVFNNVTFPTGGDLSCNIVDYTDVSFNVGSCRITVDVPPEPLTVTSASVSSGEGILSVSAGNTNGATVIYNEYSIDGGNTYNLFSALASSFRVCELQNGIPTTVLVRSVTNKGVTATNSFTVTAKDLPSKPTITGIVPGNTILTITVEDGDINGGTFIGYSVSLNNGDYNQIASGDITNILGEGTIIVRGLTNGNSYKVRVKTISDVGTSPRSVAQYGTPYTAPVVPIVNNITALNGAIQFEYTLPNNDNGGKSIIGYKYRLNGTTEGWVYSSPAIIPSLTNGTEYSLELKAVNLETESAYSSASSPVTPFNVPGSPIISQILPGDGQVYVYFNPIELNGSTLTKIQYNLGAGWLDASGLTSPLTITGLTNKTFYNISIKAINSGGDSYPSNIVQVLPGSPQPPEITNVVFGDKQLTVIFNMPMNNGKITGVLGGVSTSPSITPAMTKLTGAPALTDTSYTVIIPKLNNGTSYYVSIQLANAVGSSKLSNVYGPIVPAGVPVAPVITNTVITGLGTASVYIAPPINNGDAISKFMYSINSGTTKYDLNGLSSPFTITDLSFNTPYTFVLYAQNKAGISVASKPSKPVTVSYLVPPAPAKLTASIVRDSFSSYASPVFYMNVSFAAPVVNALTPITSYAYALNPTGNNITYTDLSTNVLPLKIPVNANTNYAVSVIARNMVGNSLPSAATAPITYVFLPPFPPTIKSANPLVNGTAEIVYTASTLRNVPVTKYMYTLNEGATLLDFASINASGNLVVTDLSNNVPISSLKLVAVSAVGNSTLSPAAKPFTIIYSTPAFPVLAAPLISGKNASISFPTPLSNGSPITGYIATITFINAAKVVTTTTVNFSASPLVLESIASGNYSVTVKSVNDLGQSAASAAKTFVIA